MRMVVDLSDLDQSRWINLTGASGHAFQANYWDQAPLWADGRTTPMFNTEAAARPAAANTLTLTP
jgi:penicillin amidase